MSHPQDMVYNFPPRSCYIVFTPLQQMQATSEGTATSEASHTDSTNRRGVELSRPSFSMYAHLWHLNLLVTIVVVVVPRKLSEFVILSKASTNRARKGWPKKQRPVHPEFLIRPRHYTCPEPHTGRLVKQPKRTPKVVFFQPCTQKEPVRLEGDTCNQARPNLPT